MDTLTRQLTPNNPPGPGDGRADAYSVSANVKSFSVSA
jgi:hypothetical protein